MNSWLLRLSLRNKWMLSTAMTIFVTYAAVAIVMYAALYAWLENNEEANAVRTVDDLSGYLTSQKWSLSIDDLQSQSGLMQAILNQDQTIRLFQLDGQAILQINNASPSVPLNEEVLNGKMTIEQQTVERVDAFVVHRLVQIGPSFIIVQLVHPLTTFQSMMQYVLTTMLLMGAVSVLLAALGGYGLSNYFMRPLLTLRDSMQQVKDYGLAREVDVTYEAKDEIADVLSMYKEMLSRLDASFKQQQQFVFDASHELRTPIQAIEGHLSLIRRWGKDDPAVLEESLSYSLQEISRMKTLMEELLLLARDERVETELVDVYMVTQRVCTEMEKLYPEATIELSMTGVAKRVEMTEQAWVQVVRNIVENAIRYNNKVPHIQVSLLFEERLLRLVISDNGIGIAEENLPLIFQRFYKVDDARVHVEGSTGLGLSIVSMLVEKYNGTIEVESEIGIGTTFVLSFVTEM